MLIFFLLLLPKFQMPSGKPAMTVLKYEHGRNHFENTHIYTLVKEQCRLIFCYS